MAIVTSSTVSPSRRPSSCSRTAARGRTGHRDVQRPSSTLIGNYHGTADQSFSILIGVTPQNPPNGAYILDPVLMDKLDNPNAAEFDGLASDNFFRVLDAGDLGNIFEDIVTGLLCGDIQVDKTADPTDLPAEGGSVTYTYRVSNIGEQGSAPFTFDSAEDTLVPLLVATRVAHRWRVPVRTTPVTTTASSRLARRGCTPAPRPSSETTQNWGCFTFEYVNSGGATTEDCDDATVLVAEPTLATPPPPPDEPSSTS